MQDRELVERMLSGDKSAQRQFYDRHVERIYRLAYRMTGEETAARDCTQTVFIRLFDRLGTFRGEAALSTWVHAVAVSIIAQWRRETARRRRREIELDAAEEIAVAPRIVDGAVTDAVRRALDGLACPYRTVVIMHDLEGYTHEEIGAALGIGTGTSKMRLSRARKQLRTALADFGGDLIYD